MDSTTYHPTTTASSILARLGHGSADTEFAEAINDAVDAVIETGKKAEISIKVTIKPDDHHGMIMLPLVTAKIPKLAPAGSIMHRGPNGSLLTQQEFLLGDMMDDVESKASARLRDMAPEKEKRPVSGRLPVVGLKPAPAPAPIKDEAGK